MKTVSELIELAGGTLPMAAAIGVHRTTILTWKRKNQIPGNRVKSISKVTGVKPDALLPLVPTSQNRKHNG